MTYDDVSVDRMRDWCVSTTEFVRDNFRVEPDRWQRKVLDEFDSPDPKKRIAMVACVGPGKSAVEAWCGWKFLACFGDAVDKPKGLATSITSDNLRDNLWAEFSKWQAQSQFLSNCFTWTTSRIFANGHESRWFIGARAWPKTASPDEQGKTFSGLHSRYVLVLADESGGIPVPVLRAGEQALSTCEWGRILQGGNPLSLEGMLYAASSTYRQLWTLVRVSGDPNDPDAYVNAPRLLAHHVEGDQACGCPRCWAAQQIAAYGVDNPWVQAYILGMFPKGTINTLLSVEEIEAAMKRTYRYEEYGYAQKRLAIDMARFGDDRTVLWPRQGLANFRPIVMRHARTTEIAGRAAVACDLWGKKGGLVEQITVDDTGHWGAGVIDQLLAGQYPVIPILYHDKALDPRYANRRAEMWFNGADAIKRGAALPFLPEMVGELSQPTYVFVNGKIQLEPKDLVKKRLGRSPDLADACMQTYAFPDQPREQLHRAHETTHALTEFNPNDVAQLVAHNHARAEMDFDPNAL